MSTSGSDGGGGGGGATVRPGGGGGAGGALVLPAAGMLGLTTGVTADLPGRGCAAGLGLDEALY